ncbi:hypothetical protein [Microbispora sp. H10836]|uniref:hypothetical protein n=1 Tax=Microbispora sp. H10836 TaxID=2729106 RepID=UPI001475B94A|nr:hypothetical protein [Microbispora sp. H10836]
MKTSRGRLVRLAASATASALSLALLPTTQASAAQAGRCELTWRYPKSYSKEYVELTVRCLPNNAGDTIWKVNLWADDTVGDDLIVSYPTQCAFPVPYPVTKEIKWTVYAEYLDEDLLDRDEVYLGVWFRNAGGNTYGIQTNTIAGWWGKAVDTGFGPPKRTTLGC